MMLYLISTGTYSDYSVRALLEGPADLDMHQLFLQHSKDATDLDFTAWLCAHHGCKDAAYHGTHLDSLGLESSYQFGHNFPVSWPSPLWGVEPAKPDCEHQGRKNYFGGVHSWNRIWDGKGKRWWECYHCHRIVPVDDM